jgi:hypothetical protein
MQYYYAYAAKHIAQCLNGFKQVERKRADEVLAPTAGSATFCSRKCIEIACEAGKQGVEAKMGLYGLSQAAHG